MKRRLLGVLPWTVVLGMLPAGAVPFAAEATQRFEVTASRYKFDPARIEVRQGDVVELVLRSADTDHGLAIKAYGVKVAIPKGGESRGGLVRGRAAPGPSRSSARSTAARATSG